MGEQFQTGGLDNSEKMVAMAQELVSREKLADRINLRCGDGLTLPYEATSLDGIFMSFTLELFDTPEIPRVLSECRRVLKPGGRIVVAAVSKAGHEGLMVRAFEWTHRHFPNLMDCRPIYVQRALEAAGFTVDAAETQSMWVPVEIVRGVKST